METHEFMLALGLLEGLLREGCRLQWMEDRWHVVRGDGESLCSGGTLYELILCVLRADMEV